MAALLDVLAYVVCIVGGLLVGAAFVLAWSLLGGGPTWVGAGIVTIVVGVVRGRRPVTA